MEEINKFHLWSTELMTLINEVDYLEKIVVDAMVDEQNAEQHRKLNDFHSQLEIQREELSTLLQDIRATQETLNGEAPRNVETISANETKVDFAMSALHLLKDEICNYINNEVHQRNIA